MLALAGSEGCLESGRVLVARQRRRQIRGGRIQEKKNNFSFFTTRRDKIANIENE